MNNSTLKQLLLEYSRKRNKEIVEANIKKEKIYQENPRLQEIDDELSKFSIQTAKSILQTNDRSLLDTLKSKKEYLLNEKNEITFKVKKVKVQLGKNLNLDKKLKDFNDMHKNVIKYSGTLNMKHASEDGSYTLKKSEEKSK